MTDALRKKLARIAAKCSDPSTTDALDKVIAVLDRAALAAPAVPPQPLGYITPHAHKFLRSCKLQTANTTTAIYRHRQDDTDVPIYTAPPVKDSLTTALVAAAPDAHKGEP